MKRAETGSKQTKVDTEPSKESSLKTLQRELKAAWESLRDVGIQLQKSSIRLEAYHQIDVSNSKISWMDFEAYFIETGKAEDEALMKKIAAMTPETREDIRSRILTTIPLTESEKSRVANRACSFGKMFLFSLAAGGQQGVEHLLKIMREEINRNMVLMGCKNLKELNSSKIIYRK